MLYVVLNTRHYKYIFAVNIYIYSSFHGSSFPKVLKLRTLKQCCSYAPRKRSKQKFTEVYFSIIIYIFFHLTIFPIELVNFSP